ncbi:hypothetical protein D1110_05790 [Actinobacillus pleuropneumoniae]|nr:hypothetical protein D1110_05790 [Actinobacillus pleuropneumoniae]
MKFIAAVIFFLFSSKIIYPNISSYINEYIFDILCFLMVILLDFFLERKVKFIRAINIIGKYMKMFFTSFFFFIFLKEFVYPYISFNIHEIALDICFGSIFFIVIYLRTKLKNK